MLEKYCMLTQLEIAELFGKGRSTIAEHISAIFEDGELEAASVCWKFRQTAKRNQDHSDYVPCD